MKYFLMIFIFPMVSWGVAPTSATKLPSGKTSNQWAFFYPYIPEKMNYGLELGAMWEEDNLYWLGGDMGFHVGRCVLSESQTCQQYFDLIGGAGGRDGLTTGLALGALRWQFVNAPSPFSPSIRLFTGLMNIRDNVRDKSQLTYGMGYGYAVGLHPGMDLRIELRVGHADRLWTQTYLSFQLKMEKWLDYFAHKLKNLGVGTVKATGDVIEGTLEMPGQVMDWMGPRKKTEPPVQEN